MKYNSVFFILGQTTNLDIKVRNQLIMRKIILFINYIYNRISKQNII